MAFSAALHCPNLPTTSSPQFSERLCFQRLSGRRESLTITRASKGKGHSLQIIKSVLDNRKSCISDNGSTEPTRVLLERLFVHTQKLEEQMSRDSRLPEDFQLGLNLEILESDLQAALEALKKKEEDLQDAERTVLLENTELNCAKEELERREQEIAAACSKQEKLEEELKEASRDLASQARHVEDLKLRLKERDQEIADMQSAFSVKLFELDEMRNELVRRTEEASKTDSELLLKSQLLNDANEVIKKQKLELQDLQKAIQKKEEELEVSVMLRKCEVENLKVVEANLEKQTMEWLLAREELKKLGEDASQYTREINKTLEDFKRVKKLLADVRSELVSSQKSLASSRQKMEDQELQLGKQLAELEEQKLSVMSYMMSLKNAQIEVESERVKLRVAEAQNKELERDLSIEKKLVEQLHEEVNKERDSLQMVMQEMSDLQEELDQKNSEFEEMHNVLQVKEAELADAKLEIQHLKSEVAFLGLILEEKDVELFTARKKLEELNQEVEELKMLMNSKENKLIQATTLLLEKEEHVQIMQHELTDTKLKFTEAETVVERIVDLTNKLVVSIKDEDLNSMSSVDDTNHMLLQQLFEKPSDGFKWQKKQLETELELTRVSLRMKEMEVLGARRTLTVKDEELNAVIGRLDAREKEVKKMKEEMLEDAHDLRKLYALVQERIGEKSIGDMAIEKLQLEAAQLEVEAATSALYKLAEMSQELLNKASLSINDTSVLLQTGSDSRSGVVENESFIEVKAEVTRLSSLTELLVSEAGIVGTAC